MRFWEGLSVAQIARGLGVPQKGLYRRFERALARMRRDLERGGLSRHDMRDLLGEEGCVTGGGGDIGRPRPSKSGETSPGTRRSA